MGSSDDDTAVAVIDQLRSLRLQLSRIAHALEDRNKAGATPSGWWQCEHCSCSSNHYSISTCKVCGVPKDA